MKSRIEALTYCRMPSGLSAGLAFILLLGLSANAPLGAEPDPIAGELPDPRSLHMPPPPVAEKLAMYAAADAATRIFTSVHAEEARIRLIQERSRMVEKARNSVSLADQVTRQQGPRAAKVPRPVAAAPAPEPYYQPQPVPAPDTALYPTPARIPAPVAGNPSVWQSTAAIQKPAVVTAAQAPSPAKVIAELEAAMDEISQWPDNGKLVSSPFMMH